MRSGRAGFLAQLRVGGAGRAGSARGVSRSPSRERAHACGEAWGLVLYRGIDQTSTYIKIAEARILTHYWKSQNEPCAVGLERQILV